MGTTLEQKNRIIKRCLGSFQEKPGRKRDIFIY
jgi:hypothetical protein